MRVLKLLIPALALLLGPSALAQSTYSDRPIKMIVPLAAASAVGVAARIVTQKMADNMGQQFVILNQPGASGLIRAEQVARAEPDGYTIGGFNDGVMTMVPNLQSKMRWDILKDFERSSLVATVEWGLIANNKASVRTAADLIAAAKAAPGKIDYASGGPGSPQHLAMAMFASAAGVSLTHVPYKGATLKPHLSSLGARKKAAISFPETPLSRLRSQSAVLHPILPYLKLYMRPR
jgi:tripartite-type tricarboxylate transporter receptor subunit TctC